MPLPDPVHFDDLTLRSDDADYPDALLALVRALGPDCDAAYALLERPPPAVDEAGVPDPRATWDAVESAFVPTWTGWRNEGVRGRWHRVALPDRVDELAALADLVRTGVGRWFVHTLALAAADEWVLVAVPHSRRATVAGVPAVREAASVSLAPFRAALLDAGRVVSWTDGDREFRIEAGHLRVGRDGRARGWPLSRLRSVERAGQRGLRLRWAGRAERDSDGVLRRAVDHALSGRSPPRTLELPDEATRDAAAGAIESFLAAYRPAT